MPKVRTSALAAAVVRDITKEGFFHPAASRGFIYLGLRFFMGKTKLIVVTDRHVISSKLLLKGIRSEISAVVILKTVSIAILKMLGRLRYHVESGCSMSIIGVSRHELLNRN